VAYNNQKKSRQKKSAPDITRDRTLYQTFLEQTGLSEVISMLPSDSREGGFTKQLAQQLASECTATTDKAETYRRFSPEMLDGCKTLMKHFSDEGISGDLAFTKSRNGSTLSFIPNSQKSAYITLLDTRNGNFQGDSYQRGYADSGSVYNKQKGIRDKLSGFGAGSKPQIIKNSNPVTGGDEITDINAIFGVRTDVNGFTPQDVIDHVDRTAFGKNKDICLNVLMADTEGNLSRLPAALNNMSTIHVSREKLKSFVSNSKPEIGSSEIRSLMSYSRGAVNNDRDFSDSNGVQITSHSIMHMDEPGSTVDEDITSSIEDSTKTKKQHALHETMMRGTLVVPQDLITNAGSGRDAQQVIQRYLFGLEHGVAGTQSKKFAPAIIAMTSAITYDESYVKPKTFDVSEKGAESAYEYISDVHKASTDRFGKIFDKSAMDEIVKKFTADTSADKSFEPSNNNGELVRDTQKEYFRHMSKFMEQNPDDAAYAEESDKLYSDIIDRSFGRGYCTDAQTGKNICEINPKAVAAFAGGKGVYSTELELQSAIKSQKRTLSQEGVHTVSADGRPVVTLTGKNGNPKEYPEEFRLIAADADDMNQVRDVQYFESNTVSFDAHSLHENIPFDNIRDTTLDMYKDGIKNMPDDIKERMSTAGLAMFPKETVAAYRQRMAQAGVNEFWTNKGLVISQTLRANGVDIHSLYIDSQGVAQYTGKAEVNMHNSNGSRYRDEKITGEIGQIFEPDSRQVIEKDGKFVPNPKYGSILMKSQGSDGRLIFPGYSGTITPLRSAEEIRQIQSDYEKRLQHNPKEPLPSDLELVELYADKKADDPEQVYIPRGMGSPIQRTKCKSIVDVQDETIRQQLNLAFTSSTNFSDNAGSLNKCYRAVAGEMHPEHHIEHLMAKGMGINDIYAIAESERNKVVYDSDSVKNATMLGISNAESEIARDVGFGNDGNLTVAYAQRRINAKYKPERFVSMHQIDESQPVVVNGRQITCGRIYDGYMRQDVPDADLSYSKSSDFTLVSKSDMNEHDMAGRGSSVNTPTAKATGNQVYMPVPIDGKPVINNNGHINMQYDKDGKAVTYCPAEVTSVNNIMRADRNSADRSNMFQANFKRAQYVDYGEPVDEYAMIQYDTTSGKMVVTPAKFSTDKVKPISEHISDYVDSRFRQDMSELVTSKTCTDEKDAFTKLSSTPGIVDKYRMEYLENSTNDVQFMNEFIDMYQTIQDKQLTDEDKASMVLHNPDYDKNDKNSSETISVFNKTENGYEINQSVMDRLNMASQNVSMSTCGVMVAQQNFGGYTQDDAYIRFAVSHDTAEAERTEAIKKAADSATFEQNGRGEIVIKNTAVDDTISLMKSEGIRYHKGVTSPDAGRTLANEYKSVTNLGGMYHRELMAEHLAVKNPKELFYDEMRALRMTPPSKNMIAGRELSSHGLGFKSDRNNPEKSSADFELFKNRTYFLMNAAAGKCSEDEIEDKCKSLNISKDKFDEIVSLDSMKPENLTAAKQAADEMYAMRFNMVLSHTDSSRQIDYSDDEIKQAGFRDREQFDNASKILTPEELASRQTKDRENYLKRMSMLADASLNGNMDAYTDEQTLTDAGFKDKEQFDRLAGMMSYDDIALRQAVNLDSMCRKYGVISDRLPTVTTHVKSINRGAEFERVINVGDKALKSDGNKGVLGAVVDMEMIPDDNDNSHYRQVIESRRAVMGDRIADELEINSMNQSRLATFSRDNPDIREGGSSYTPSSRMNASVAYEACQRTNILAFAGKNMDIKNGDVTTEMGAACMPDIQTNMTVDAKGKDVNEDNNESGRNASVQLALALSEKGAHNLAHELFSVNTEAIKNQREAMISLGCDITPEGKLVVGYTPHSSADENGNIKFEKRPIIQPYLPDSLTKNTKIERQLAMFDDMTTCNIAGSIDRVTKKLDGQTDVKVPPQYDGVINDDKSVIETYDVAFSAYNVTKNSQYKGFSSGGFDTNKNNIAVSKNGDDYVPEIATVTKGASSKSYNDLTKVKRSHFLENLPDEGGFIKLSVPVTMKTGQTLENVGTEENPEYHLPVMSSALRQGRETIGDELKFHDYTKHYENIWDLNNAYIAKKADLEFLEGVRDLRTMYKTFNGVATDDDKSRFPDVLDKYAKAAGIDKSSMSDDDYKKQMADWTKGKLEQIQESAFSSKLKSGYKINLTDLTPKNAYNENSGYAHVDDAIDMSISADKTKMAQYQTKVQSEYGYITADICERVFNTKDNNAKNMLKSVLDVSSTKVISPDPSLMLDEVAINQSTADSLGLHMQKLEQDKDNPDVWTLTEKDENGNVTNVSRFMPAKDENGNNIKFKYQQVDNDGKPVNDIKLTLGKNVEYTDVNGNECTKDMMNMEVWKAPDGTFHDHARVAIGRDPMLSAGGFRYMRARITPDTEDSRIATKGAKVHPSAMKSFEGDFDGDTIYMVPIKGEKAYNEAMSKFTFESELTNREVAPDRNLGYELNFNTGLDVASGLYADNEIKKQKEANGETYVSAKDKLDEVRKAIKDRDDKGLKTNELGDYDENGNAVIDYKAFEEMHELVEKSSDALSQAYRAGFGSDSVSFANDEKHFESLFNQVFDSEGNKREKYFCPKAKTIESFGMYIGNFGHNIGEFEITDKNGEKKTRIELIRDGAVFEYTDDKNEKHTHIVDSAKDKESGFDYTKYKNGSFVSNGSAENKLATNNCWVVSADDKTASFQAIAAKAELTGIAGTAAYKASRVTFGTDPDTEKQVKANPNLYPALNRSVNGKSMIDIYQDKGSYEAAATALTHPVSQSVMQLKHNTPEEIRQKVDVIKTNLPNIWNGVPMKGTYKDENGVDRTVTAEDLADRYRDLCSQYPNENGKGYDYDAVNKEFNAFSKNITSWEVDTEAKSKFKNGGGMFPEQFKAMFQAFYASKGGLNVDEPNPECVELMTAAMSKTAISKNTGKPYSYIQGLNIESDKEQAPLLSLATSSGDKAEKWIQAAIEGRNIYGLDKNQGKGNFTAAIAPKAVVENYKAGEAVRQSDKMPEYAPFDEVKSEKESIHSFDEHKTSVSSEHGTRVNVNAVSPEAQSAMQLKLERDAKTVAKNGVTDTHKKLQQQNMGSEQNGTVFSAAINSQNEMPEQAKMWTQQIADYNANTTSKPITEDMMQRAINVSSQSRGITKNVPDAELVDRYRNNIINHRNMVGAEVTSDSAKAYIESEAKANAAFTIACRQEAANMSRPDAAKNSPNIACFNMIRNMKQVNPQMSASDMRNICSQTNFATPVPQQSDYQMYNDIPDMPAPVESVPVSYDTGYMPSPEEIAAMEQYNQNQGVQFSNDAVPVSDDKAVSDVQVSNADTKQKNTEKEDIKKMDTQSVSSPADDVLDISALKAKIEAEMKAKLEAEMKAEMKAKLEAERIKIEAEMKAKMEAESKSKPAFGSSKINSLNNIMDKTVNYTDSNDFDNDFDF